MTAAVDTFSPAGARRASRVANVARWLADFARAKPIGAAGGVVVILVVLIALLADVIAPYDPNVHAPLEALKGPSGDHLLGTDQYGRDMFSRLVHGARVSVEVASLGVVTFATVAAVIGVIGAYSRGVVDFVVGRLIDVIQALPGIVLLITLVLIVGNSIFAIAFVLGLASGVTSSRVVRGAALGVMAQPYVEAARSLGCPAYRIMVRYVLVNVAPVIIILATINIGFLIIAESSLSFLGYGVPPPAPTWGGMLSREGRQFMVDAPWLFIGPVIALALVVFSANMLGDAVRDRLDPRMRGSR